MTVLMLAVGVVLVAVAGQPTGRVRVTMPTLGQEAVVVVTGTDGVAGLVHPHPIWVAVDVRVFVQRPVPQMLM